MLFKADLHIHSCLSPCASLEMSPSAIAEKAKSAGLDLIAITDHNSALNAPALRDACVRTGGIHALFGMEVTTAEEIHCLALFDHPDKALELGEYIYSLLPEVKNKADKYGDQVYVDADENILGEVEKFLGVAADISYERLGNTVHERGGLFIPAHIDREIFGLIHQVGYLPDFPFDAVEISRHYLKRGYDPNAISGKYSYLSSSDSHYLDGVGSVINYIEAEDFSIEALRAAISKKGIVTEFK
ncbi:MAG TPA: PHP domain-containing protein [Spirochaetota bacterium]|nr:PHP domain-containing protein [Spirochaetota bacterium]HOR44276.1 PHP domain-containing protein [Spirochaetota bacterium]HOU85315.1 PHP domain-containing protein [Spirochaetota bacterium]HPK55756.1 PHP domain-containing protein [Spirochaetota bacterium]HQE59085.1 PHP domain-containing protein [Spirochaetota bacterium]